VESDKKSSSQYCSFLKKHGFETVASYSAEDAMSQFKSRHIDIVLSAIELPGIDGTMMAGAIRKLDANVPIMIITSLDDIASKKRAFSVEIDDYMVKPIDLNELTMRMEALLRRAHTVSKRQVVIGEALLNADTLSVTVRDNETILPPKEFLLLFKLCSTPGQVFTRRDIMNDIWGMNTDSDKRTVDVHVKRLRGRFDSSARFAIETVRGVGYRAVVL
ncbi:MAG: response regulator transcription factor, partial [Eggerthellaceae bacterium]|nr:response regulator transcription factor [Eggerthellaceae bacterium]